MSTAERLLLISTSVVLWVFLALALIHFMATVWPRRRNRLQRWKRQLVQEWQRNPLPNPAPNLVLREYVADAVLMGQEVKS